MKDFTLDAYKEYVNAIRSSYSRIIRFDEYFMESNKPDNFCILRHDIDRSPEKALIMAQLEHELGIKATYYIRSKSHTLKPSIIREIFELGHEIGYHYENLSDASGDLDEALKDFEQSLDNLKQIVPIKTIAMHGRPLKSYDNRDLWKDQENHELLKSKFDLLGEVYLDIDYSDIAYITDTGRNWLSEKNNIRDKIKDSRQVDLQNSDSLMRFLKNLSSTKLIFQIHPERWIGNYYINLFIDLCSNQIKQLIKIFYNVKKISI